MHLKRTTLLGTTVLAGVLAVSAPAFAQSSAEPEATQVEEIVVTGSRIRRDPTTAPTPIIQISGDQLMETGLTTVIDYLATIPALSNSLVPSDTTGSGLNDGGLELPNLRSLGTGRTLTLIDGLRHVGSSAGSLAVDVSTIPRLLIENIEIVTGGASSVYGADAVSGVLNFQLRKDYEGAELDANYAWINEDGQASYRISGLVGKNFFDDRLNLYAHGEYEKIEEVTSMDIDWLRNTSLIFGIDADPTSATIGPVYDGKLDSILITSGAMTRLDRPRWGSTTLANNQAASPLNEPLVPYQNCTAYNSSACYSVDPTKTYWYTGTTARLANFGQRIGMTGASRPYTIGGDGENPSLFSTESRVPQQESQRYQVGGTFRLTDAITASLEAKYVNESAFDVSQPTFFDVYLADIDGANSTNAILGTSSFRLRYSDNAFLPANVKAAIASNQVVTYSAPTATTGGIAGASTTRAWADHRMFGPERYQDNTREVQRYVARLNGVYDQVAFVKNLSWDLAYTYGKMENVNEEHGVDVLRFALASDAVVDTAGIVNGRPGEIVCRAQRIAASGGSPFDYNWGYADLRDYATGAAALSECKPLNIFGAGNQSQEALDYVNAFITVREMNEQQDALFTVSGQLWDFWGAGPIGVALGGEYRKETTEGIGRSADTGDRWLFLNTGADFPESSYESNEYFAEVSIPLFRDSFLGQYAELSGSYRYSDYTTIGETDVYGVNLVYRPISDIAFKTSFNTSIRVPSLSENFRPYSQTFANGFSDPCDTRNINAAGLAADIKANRIANCTALATAMGLSYDFAGTTADANDDYNPLYSSGVAGVNGGNPFLQPEESESFTFSTVLRPRFIPDFSLVLDYYEIEITNVIAAVSAPVAAATCVNGPTLNAAACATIFRNTGAAFAGTTAQLRSEAFKVGAPTGDPIGGFIQGSVNYAKRTVRGLDFTANYSLDAAERLGMDIGRFAFSVNGSWLIEQKDFTDIANPAAFTEYASGVYYPRVRMTSRLTWEPTEALAVTWTADWQTSQDIVQYRNFIANADSQPVEYLRTGNFVRNDLTVRYDVTDDVTLRAGITNIFDAEQAPWLGTALYSNFDPYGRRFNVGLNWKMW
jgi:outer membrane receptor protein involved in Fe transport